MIINPLPPTQQMILVQQQFALTAAHVKCTCQQIELTANRLVILIMEVVHLEKHAAWSLVNVLLSLAHQQSNAVRLSLFSNEN